VISATEEKKAMKVLSNNPGWRTASAIGLPVGVLVALRRMGFVESRSLYRPRDGYVKVEWKKR
jgi:hypothetical protein